ncbi:hypothetical protein AB0E59_06325 [Lentzea sp. NPDC034063]|uniref:hypothetical protein n=1 Tax=unclassified Lentzea TaxID=2643253 RepID=UPI00340CC631
MNVSVESGDWQRNVVVPDAVQSTVPRVETHADEQIWSVPRDRVIGSLRHTWELTGQQGIRQQSTLEARPFVAVALHATLQRAVAREDLSSVTTATAGRTLANNLLKALSSQGYRIEVGGPPLVLKADLHDRELLDVVGDRYLVRATPSWVVVPAGAVPLLSGRDESVLLDVDQQGLADLGLDAARSTPRAGPIRCPAGRRRPSPGWRPLLAT